MDARDQTMQRTLALPGHTGGVLLLHLNIFNQIVEPTMYKSTVILTLISLLMCISLHSQSIEEEIDRLNSVKEELILKSNVLKDSIESISKMINSLVVKKNVDIEGRNYIEVITSMEATIKDEPSFSGNVIGDVATGKPVRTYEYKGRGYWSCSIGTLAGYINEVFFVPNEELKVIQESRKSDYEKLEDERQKQTEIEVKEREEKRKEERRAAILAIYDYETAVKILSGQIWLGMTTTMARLSIGSPNDINRSVGSYGVHEQWVYDSRNLYLYFENDILTSWQE